VRPRRRILVLAPRYPYPVIGGDRLRIHALCRELAKEHDLTLLALCDTRAELAAPAPDDGVFRRIERVYLPKWRSLLNVLGALPGRLPLQVAYYRSAEFARRLAQLLPEHDLCLAHLIRTGHYIRHAPLPRVLEMTDAISLNYRRVKALPGGRGLKALAYALEAGRLLDYERAAIGQFDLVTLVSSTDADFLLPARRPAHVLVCSNGVDLEALPFRDRSGGAPVLAFIGAMTTLQNLDACLYFAGQVLPLLRRHGDWRLRVIGRIGEADHARLAAHPGVEVLANVDSISAAVGDASIGVAPIRLGAGVQNKILEYMALGLPVVASSIGLEGLQARPGSEILIADTPQAYVAHLLALQSDPAAARALGRAGFEYVRAQHAWPSRLAPLLEAVRRL